MSPHGRESLTACTWVPEFPDTFTTHPQVELVVLGQRHQQLRAQPGIQQQHAGAVADGVAEVQAAGALLGQRDQVAQPLPLELTVVEQHLQRARLELSAETNQSLIELQASPSPNHDPKETTCSPHSDTTCKAPCEDIGRTQQRNQHQNSKAVICPTLSQTQNMTAMRHHRVTVL